MQYSLLILILASLVLKYVFSMLWLALWHKDTNHNDDAENAELRACQKSSRIRCGYLILGGVNLASNRVFLALETFFTQSDWLMCKKAI